VDSGGDAGLFGDDDVGEEHWKRKREKDLGGEGDLDELDFEETFADDEEKMDADDKEDEEAKELEVYTSHSLPWHNIDSILPTRNDSNASTKTLTRLVRAMSTTRMTT
jgi:hypothetical protein